MYKKDYKKSRKMYLVIEICLISLITLAIILILSL